MVFKVSPVALDILWFFKVLPVALDILWFLKCYL